jgi:hypothetical protein
MAIAVSKRVFGRILISRPKENREIETRDRGTQAGKQRERDKATLDQLEGKELVILRFYSIPQPVRR